MVHTSAPFMSRRYTRIDEGTSFGFPVIAINGPARQAQAPA